MANDQDSDPALIRRAQAGDADAVVRLYQRHAPVVFRYLYVRVADHALAEDLTGDTFLKWVEGLPHNADQRLSLSTVLLNIAHAGLADYVLPSSHALPAPHPVNGHTLLVLFRGLTEDQQLALQLRLVERHTLASTAGLMQKTHTAVKALQWRALRQVAGQLQVEA